MKNENSTIRLPKTKTGFKSFNKIIEVSKTLFANKGFSQTSINEIIENAKIATGTFYNYFDDKRAVYDYLLNDYSTQIRTRIAKAVKDLPSSEAREREGIKTYIKFALEDKLSYRIIWESLFIEKDLFINYYKNFGSSYIMQLKNSLEKGEIRGDIDFETLSFALMGITSFLGLQVVFKDELDDNYDRDKYVDFIADNIMVLLKNGMFIKH